MQQVHNIREAVNAFKVFSADRTGRPASSTAWSSRLIYYYLSMYTNQVVYEKRLRNKLTGTSEYIWQTLPCVELELVDRADDCPCEPASGCMWLKSKHPLPKPLEGQVRAVVSNTGQMRYDHVKWEEFNEKLNSRFEPFVKVPYFTWKSVNGEFHIYVHNAELLESVSVVMIPEDMIEFMQFPSCGKESQPLCSMLDQPFLIDRELQPLVFERTLQSLANQRGVASGADILNNNNDDTSAQAPLK